MHNYNQLSFSTVIPDVVSKYANNNAMSFVGEEPITYAQMGEQIAALRVFLEKLSVKPGDKVLIYSQNMPNWGIAYFAIQCMGAVVVPVLPDFNGHELQNVLKHSEAKSIFVSQSLEYKLAEIDTEDLNLIIRIDDYTCIQGGDQTLKYDKKAECHSTYQSKENELSILLYTSGTTGDSKGVMLTQKNVILNAFQANEIQPIMEHDRFLSILPLSHTYENTLGLILPILKGGNIFYLRKPPTASVLLPALKVVKPHLMMTVPMIIEKVYRNSVLPNINKKSITRNLYKFAPTRKLLNKIAGKKLYETFGGELKFFGIGGAKLDATVERFLIEAKFPFAIGYGLTETAPLLAGSGPFIGRFQTIGPKVVESELKIHNPDPKTGEGEIWARGENVMLGYYKNIEKTKEVLTDDGWFKTGDLGAFDSHGYLCHKGRIKNMIVGANGENIYPEEIESLINNFHNVVESLVIQQKGKLVALVHFNREELEQRMREMKTEWSNKMDEKVDEYSKKVDEYIADLSIELQQYINTKVNKISRIQIVIAQNDPFQKTATQKIKRYLYC